MENYSQEFENLLQNRRSIRLFLPTPIPNEIVQDCLKMALLSPSSSNLQPWQFIRVKNPDDEIKHIFLNQSAAVTAPEIIIAVARPDLWKKSCQKLEMQLTALGSTKPPHFDYLLHYYRRIVPFGHDRGFLGIKGLIRGFIIWILGWLRPVVREGYFSSPLRERAVKSTALACQTFMLALTANGYASCPMEGFDSQRLKKKLGLPKEAITVMGISIGKANPSYIPPLRQRFDYADTVIEFN